MPSVPLLSPLPTARVFAALLAGITRGLNHRGVGQPGSEAAGSRPPTACRPLCLDSLATEGPACAAPPHLRTDRHSCSPAIMRRYPFCMLIYYLTGNGDAAAPASPREGTLHDGWAAAGAYPALLPRAEAIRDQIRRGEFAPGARLPTEETLCRTYTVSRITVIRALRDLVAEGLVERRQGRGTFVAAPVVDQDLLRLTDFIEDMAAAGLHAESRVVGKTTVVAPDHVTNALGVVTGSPVLELRRLRLADGAPIAFDITWLTPTFAALVADADLEHQTIYRILEQEHHVAVERGEYLIEAVAATPAIAAALDVASDAPSPARPPHLLGDRRPGHLPSGALLPGRPGALSASPRTADPAAGPLAFSDPRVRPGLRVAAVARAPGRAAGHCCPAFAPCSPSATEPATVRCENVLDRRCQWQPTRDTTCGHARQVVSNLDGSPAPRIDHPGLAARDLFRMGGGGALWPCYATVI